MDRKSRKFLSMRFFNDFNEKWYFIGNLVGFFAGIAAGWLMAVYVIS